MDDLLKTFQISSSGMQVQGARLRVISQNIANADSLPQDANGKPYRRQIITFKNELDRSIGLDTVRVNKVKQDMSDFGKRYEPSHPAADADGYVLTPNVSRLTEMSDMREAQRSYEANMQVIKSSRSMLNGTIELLRR